ncbi:MAG: 4-hydroxybutyrate CoA-transferase, partial [Bacteroidales bacterium]|nr:4-hydroxybutyrate CoA-transferase [Bacteroidales bacterium]
MKELRYVSADEAVASVRSGDHIHLSSVASVPHILVDALVRRARAGEVEDLHFHHFHTEGDAPYSDPEFEGIFFEQGFFVGPNVRANVNAGYADYIPVHLSDTQRLYRTGGIRLGAAMVQVSPPDADGMVSLGTSVDSSIAAVESARVKIAVVNPNVPFAYGDLIPVDTFDFLVKDDTPLFTKAYTEPSATDIMIGRHCAALVQDGACLQMGIGSLPNALATQLNGHKDLGIHTEMFADGVLELIKKGVITGRNKRIDTGKIV